MPRAAPSLALLLAFPLALAMILAMIGDVMAGPKENELLDAAGRGDIPAIRRLSEGVTVDARNDRGQTALLVATHANQIEAARLLIEGGANVNAKDGIQDSPYLYAGACGYLEILRMTLSHGADLKSINRFGGTALIPAAERGHVETVRTLIEAGVAVDHINNLGWTALLEAVILGDGGPRHATVVKLLVDAGANVFIPDKEGVTALSHAKARSYDEIVAILRASPNELSGGGN